MLVLVGVVMGDIDSVDEGTGEGSIERMILKMGCGHGLGCGGKSKSPDSAAVAKEGMLAIKTTV
jgi:hypothetical protein